MTAIRLFLILAVVLLPVTASAAVPWTGSPGSSVVDESSAGIYKLDNGQLSYNSSGSTSIIVARLNVTDTTATGYPGWTTMAIHAYDPGPSSQVRVTLIRVAAGTLTNIATCASSDNAMIQTSTCPILNSVDFNSGYIYEVVIEISRTSNTVSPFIGGIRLY